MGICSLPAITWPLMLIVVLEATSFLTVLVANMEIWMYSVGDGSKEDEKRGVDMSYLYGLIVSSSPIITAFLADNFFGRYTLVTVHSLIILAGYLLFITSTYITSMAFWLVLTGMTLNAIGEGINRTIFPTYCADQVMSRGGKSGEKMISLYYVFLQIGGILIICTDLSKDFVKCDGRPCFKLMFGIGLASSAVALLLHLTTTPWIHKQKVANNIVVKAVKCIIFAVTNRVSKEEGEKSSNTEEYEKTGTIMDRAIPRYGADFVEDVTQAIRVCRLFFIGIPYYVCYFGVFGIFVGQFYRVNAQIGSFTLTPIMYLTTNPVVITISVFFIKLLTKLLSNYISVTHLMKISVGGFITALAYACVIFVETKIQQDALPSNNSLVIYRHSSTKICTFTMDKDPKLRVDDMGLSEHDQFDTGIYNLSVNCLDNGTNIPYKNSWTLDIKPARNVLFLHRSGDSIKMDHITRPIHRLKSGQTEVILLGCQSSGEYLTTYLISSKPYKYLVYESFLPIQAIWWFNQSEYLSRNNNQTKTELFEHFAWESLDRRIQYGNNVNSLRTFDISLKGQSGAVFAYFDGGDCLEPNRTEIYKYSLISPYGVSILWMFPQLMLMALVEALLTVSANEFAYSQTVPSMRSFIQALWLLTSAIGSVFGLALNQFGLSVTTKCIVYSISMIATTTVFAFTSRSYNYIIIDSGSSSEQKDEESRSDSEELKKKHQFY